MYVPTRFLRCPQVQLAPLGCLVFSAEQFATLMACHGVLVRHMFSKRPYCAAAAVAAAEARWGKADQQQPQGDDGAQATTAAAGEAGGGGPSSQLPTAAPGAPPDPDPVRELVLGILNRAVLLHDGAPLLARHEEPEPPEPESLAFLLAPTLLGEASLAGSKQQEARAAAGLAAAFHGWAHAVYALLLVDEPDDTRGVLCQSM